MDFLKELIIGVKEYLDSGRKYPYPDSLVNSMNLLCIEIDNFPKTMTVFLKLLEKPVKDWCPNHLIPQEFNGDFCLMDKGSLSKEANDYMAGLDIH